MQILSPYVKVNGQRLGQMVIHWMFERFRPDNPGQIVQIYPKDHLVKNYSALHSQPLHNLLIPSHNPLILRRRSLKGKDNPTTRGCGGRKCFVGISTLPSNGKEGHIVKKIFFPIKRNQNGRKIRRPSLDFVRSIYIATLPQRPVFSSCLVSFLVVFLLFKCSSTFIDSLDYGQLR